MSLTVPHSHISVTEVGVAMVTGLELHISEVHLVMVCQVDWARAQAGAFYPPKPHIVPPTGDHSTKWF